MEGWGDSSAAPSSRSGACCIPYRRWGKNPSHTSINLCFIALTDGGSDVKTHPANVLYSVLGKQRKKGSTLPFLFSTGTHKRNTLRSPPPPLVVIGSRGSLSNDYYLYIFNSFILGSTSSLGKGPVCMCSFLFSVPEKKNDIYSPYRISLTPFGTRSS